MAYTYNASNPSAFAPTYQSYSPLPQPLPSAPLAPSGQDLGFSSQDRQVQYPYYTTYTVPQPTSPFDFPRKAGFTYKPVNEMPTRWDKLWAVVCYIFSLIFGSDKVETPKLQAQTTSGYKFESYTNNWNWDKSKTAKLAPNVHGNLSFGVVNPDGSFDSRYPIDPNQPWGPFFPSCDGLAIGGWNNSQSIAGSDPWSENIGLYKVLSSENPAGRLQLRANILNAVTQYGYKRVMMDYENYDDRTAERPELYTEFLKDLAKDLEKVGATLEVAISPWERNQRYYNMQDLLEHTNITFQLMCYDYAMGQPGQIGVISNASIAQSEKYITAMQQKGVPLNRIMIGLPAYGLGYRIDRQDPAIVAEKLKNGTLTAQSYYDGNGQIPNDDIIKWIGDWERPRNGWVKLENGETSREVFYYNPNTGVIVSAMPPSQIERFAHVMKEKFPGVAGFFDWEGQTDIQGVVMSKLQESLADG